VKAFVRTIGSRKIWQDNLLAFRNTEGEGREIEEL
jgi:hypothetical protein